jgi:hypothetical protein
LGSERAYFVAGARLAVPSTSKRTPTPKEFFRPIHAPFLPQTINNLF